MITSLYCAAVTKTQHQFIIKTMLECAKHLGEHPVLKRKTPEFGNPCTKYYEMSETLALLTISRYNDTLRCKMFSTMPNPNTVAQLLESLKQPDPKQDLSTVLTYPESTAVSEADYLPLRRIASRMKIDYMDVKHMLVRGGLFNARTNAPTTLGRKYSRNTEHYHVWDIKATKQIIRLIKGALS